MASILVYNIDALQCGPSLQLLFFCLLGFFCLLLCKADHSRSEGAPLRLLPLSNSWVGALLVSWVEQVEAMSVCRAKLIFLFLLAYRASLPSSLMDGSSLGRLFFFLPCVSIQKSSVMFVSTLLNCISPLKNDPAVQWLLGCEIWQNMGMWQRPCLTYTVQNWNDTWRHKAAPDLEGWWGKGVIWHHRDFNSTTDKI